jgi:hypothetical protein
MFIQKEEWPNCVDWGLRAADNEYEWYYFKNVCTCAGNSAARATCVGAGRDVICN